MLSSTALSLFYSSCCPPIPPSPSPLPSPPPLPSLIFHYYILIYRARILVPMDLGTIASETKMSFYGVDHALFAKVSITYKSTYPLTCLSTYLTLPNLVHFFFLSRTHLFFYHTLLLLSSFQSFFSSSCKLLV